MRASYWALFGALLMHALYTLVSVKFGKDGSVDGTG